MWPRISEIVLGIWLVSSPFVFRTSSDEWASWAADILGGAITIALALASLLTPLRKAHLAIVVVASALIGFGYISSPDSRPALQNDVLSGLLLMMFAIVPSEATVPPRTWREYNAKKSATKYNILV